MIRKLAVLFAEQTTPDEVVIFLLLAVVAIMVTAFLLYATILIALWRTRLRAVVSVGRLLFPSGEQLRKYLAEYVLAVTTSVLLTLTVAARDDAVRHLLDYDLGKLTTEGIQRAFPIALPSPEDLARPGEPPDRIALAIAAHVSQPGSAAGTGAALSIPVAALLRPTVEAGAPDHAAQWLKVAVTRVAENPWRRFPKRAHLLAAAGVLLLGYVIWFAVGRTRAIARAKEASDTEYTGVAKRFLSPAVCIALLLVSAVGASNPERVAQSAAAAVPYLEPAPPVREPEERFRRALEEQRIQIQEVAGLAEVGVRVSRLESELGLLDARIGALQGDTDGLAQALADAARAIDQQRTELNGVATSLRQLDARIGTAEANVRTAEANARSAQTSAERASASVNRLAGDMADLGRRVERVAGSMDAFQQQLREIGARLPSTGLLLVTTTPPTAYGIRPEGSRRTVASGRGTGLHALPPGRYTISSGVGTEVREIRVGGAETVQLIQAVIGAGRPPAAARGTVFAPPVRRDTGSIRPR